MSAGVLIKGLMPMSVNRKTAFALHKITQPLSSIQYANDATTIILLVLD